MSGTKKAAKIVTSRASRLPNTFSHRYVAYTDGPDLKASFTTEKIEQEI